MRPRALALPAALLVGLLAVAVAADESPRSAPARTADRAAAQDREALGLFREAEQRHGHRLARLRRLRELAMEMNDTKRLHELEVLHKRLRSRRDMHVDRLRSRLTAEGRKDLETHLRKRKDRHVIPRAPRQAEEEGREEGKDRHVEEGKDRHVTAVTPRDVGRAELRELRDRHVTPHVTPRDARPRPGVLRDRHTARRDPLGEARDRHTALRQARQAEARQAELQDRHVIRRDGPRGEVQGEPGGELQQSQQQPQDTHAARGGGRDARRDPQAELAAARITRANAEAEYHRLRKEIERDP